ncbi:MAG: VanZ family protein [Promethearchaeota archaeon]
MPEPNQRWQYYDYLKIIPAFILALLIFYFSSLSNPYPTPPSNLASIILNPLLHIVEFGALSFLVLFGLYPKVRATVLIMLSFLYAVLDEMHQLFVPYRYFDVNDLLFDLSGVLLGYLAYIIYGLIIECLRKSYQKKK